MVDFSVISTKLPAGFWSDKANQREFILWLGKRLAFTSYEDWYQLQRSQLIANKGRRLLALYGESPSKLLASVFDEHEWLLWKFNSVPIGFWTIGANQRKYLDWLGPKLGFQQLTDWYKIERCHLDMNGGTALLRYYKNSPSLTVMGVYCDHDWEQWKFASRLCKLISVETQLLKCIRSISTELNIKSLEDWYRVSQVQLLELNALGLIKKHGGLISALKAVYNDHLWDLERFTQRGRKSTQRWLAVMVGKLFQNTEILEDFEHSTIVYPSTHQSLELDIFLPAIKFALEFHGEQHYHDLHLFGPYRQYQDKDLEKQEICAKNNISLLTIPYWWDNQLPSLQATVHMFRPDLVPTKGSGEPIPTTPPHIKFFGSHVNRDNVGYFGHAMLACDWDRKSNPKGWWISEKLDGVRALWDGKLLKTKQGYILPAPPSFIDKLPNVYLDGELWMGPGTFQLINGIQRSQKTELWDSVNFCVFDSPNGTHTFEKRYKFLESLKYH